MVNQALGKIEAGSRHPHLQFGLCECLVGEPVAQLHNARLFGEVGSFDKGNHEFFAVHVERCGDCAHLGPHAPPHMPLIPVQREVLSGFR
jgi:hypothetical protein